MNAAHLPTLVPLLPEFVLGIGAMVLLMLGVFRGVDRGADIRDPDRRPIFVGDDKVVVRTRIKQLVGGTEDNMPVLGDKLHQNAGRLSILPAQSHASSLTSFTHGRRAVSPGMMPRTRAPTMLCSLGG